MNVAEFETLTRALGERIRTDAGKTAFIFLEDGEQETAHLTFGGLGDRAGQVAGCLKAWVRPGGRALLLYPSSLEFIPAFFGCLLAGVVAVPVYPPDPGRQEPSLRRLGRIARNAEPGVILTTAEFINPFRDLLSEDPAFRSATWIATDTAASGEPRDGGLPAITPDTLAFLQYTSGSTGRPKGVMVSHANIVHNASVSVELMKYSGATRFVSWLPYFHDMGLVGKILLPVYLGAFSVLMPPRAFLARPVRWLRALTRYRATSSAAPNFAYDLCTDKVRPREIPGLDLSAWECACNGSEPVRRSTLERFSDRFAACGFKKTAFYPCYGLAESTLIVAGGRMGALPSLVHLDKESLQAHCISVSEAETGRTAALVGCGGAGRNHGIRIMDPESLEPALPGRVGEIWVSGPSVAKGYWNSPGKSGSGFNARIRGLDGVPFLRTGDLGFMMDGQLFITGRMKDVIVIRGKNHYPQDIEATVPASHALLKPGGCAAFILEDGEETSLGIAAEVRERKISESRLAGIQQSIRAAVARDHGIRVSGLALIRPGTLLKTSSGKVRRFACKQAFTAGRLNALKLSLTGERSGRSASGTRTAPDRLNRTTDPDAREQMAERCVREQAAILLDLPPSRVSMDDPLYQLGFDSLMFFELLDRIQEDLSCPAAVDEAFMEMTLSGLSRILAGKRGAA